MNFHSNVTEQDLFYLHELAEQQKNQRAPKFKSGILKQTHDIKVAESLSPITEKLNEVFQSTKKISEVIKESKSENENVQETVPVEIDSDNSEGDNTKLNIKALPNSSIFNESMAKTLGRLMSSPNCLQIKASSSGPTTLEVPIYTLGGDKLRIRGNDYDLIPEIYKALSFTGYTGKSMKNASDILMMKIILNDLGYTGIGDGDSKKNIFHKNTSKFS